MKYSQVVKYWLFFGLFLVFMQIVIGGITRLTGSGLSITEWDIVFGTFPPLGESQWLEEFIKYQSTPQYQKINEGMSLLEFKFIYFWEYFHRLWARMMGFAFLLPYVIFRIVGMVDKVMSKKLGVVILFAVLAAVFGWVMVASGLIDRPWVNAYKLSIHLSIGIAVFLSLLWVILESFYQDRWSGLQMDSAPWLKWITVIFVLLCLQIFLGGVVSGMKAALPFPTWPNMNGSFIPTVLLDGNHWTWQKLSAYESSTFAPALAQFLHRNTAYAIVIISVVFFYVFLNNQKHTVFKSLIWFFFSLLFLQILLGIFTLINSLGKIPISLGVMHQSIGVLLIASSFTILYAFKKSTKIVIF
ncbi:MAG: COX15/CtaA family protein [Saprospiraceae bacterium]